MKLAATVAKRVTPSAKPRHVKRTIVIRMVRLAFERSTILASSLGDPPTFHSFGNSGTSLMLSSELRVVLVPAPHVAGMVNPFVFHISAHAALAKFLAEHRPACNIRDPACRSRDGTHRPRSGAMEGGGLQAGR